MANESLVNEIVEAMQKLEAEKSKKKAKPKKVKDVDFGVVCNGFSLMIYVDQLGYRQEECQPEMSLEDQVKLLNDFLQSLLSDEDRQFEFFGIVHCLEVKASFSTNLTEVNEKPHIHIAFIFDHRSRPITVLKYLTKFGLDIDVEKDRTLYTHEGYKVLNFQRHDQYRAYAYMTHETDQAIFEGKPTYSKDALVTSFDSLKKEEYESNYRKYFDKLFLNKYGQVQEISEENQLIIYLDECFRLGYNLEDLDSYLDTLPKHYLLKYKRKFPEYYYDGARKRYEDKSNLDVLRVSIYIEGVPECGKTYGSIHTLLDLGRKVYQVGQSSGSGGEDNIKPRDCLVYDDRIPKNCLDKADTNICELYRRNSSNGLFGGDFFIMNYNSSFEDAFKNYYKDKDDASDSLSDQALAVKSRLFIIKVSGGCVQVKQRCTRGLPEEVKLRNDKFNQFLEIFTKYISEKFDKDKLKPDVYCSPSGYKESYTYSDLYNPDDLDNF